jgi:hypothetical protein
MVSNICVSIQSIESSKKKTGKPRARRTTKSLTPEHQLRIADQLECRGDSEDVAELYEVPRSVVIDCAVVKIMRAVRHLEAMAYLRGSVDVPLVRDGFGRKLPQREVVTMPARKGAAA